MNRILRISGVGGDPVAVSIPGVVPLASNPGLVVVVGDVLATCVPAKAKSRKRNVPTNSPRVATRLLRAVGGRESIGRTFGFWLLGIELFLLSLLLLLPALFSVVEGERMG